MASIEPLRERLALKPMGVRSQRPPKDVHRVVPQATPRRGMTWSAGRASVPSLDPNIGTAEPWRRGTSAPVPATDPRLPPQGADYPLGEAFDAHGR